MKPLRILIADDHEVVREGTRLMLENEPGWEVCGIAKNGREAVEQAKELRPDIAVLDMGMPDLTGLEAARKIKRASPDSEVIIFTATESKELIRDVFESGAKGYILKADAGSHLVDAVKSVSQHKPFFTSKVSEVLFAKFMDPSPDQSAGKSAEPLTAREQDIVRLLAEGKSNKEVANTLGLSVRTAETHRANVMRKLGVCSLAGMVRYAVRSKLVES